MKGYKEQLSARRGPETHDKLAKAEGSLLVSRPASSNNLPKILDTLDRD